jgi:hypothetical protein
MWILAYMWINWISLRSIGLGTHLMVYVYMHLNFYVAHGTFLGFVALGALLMAHVCICIWAWDYAIDPLCMTRLCDCRWLRIRKVWDHQSLRGMKWQAQEYDTFDVHSFLFYMMFLTTMFTHLFLSKLHATPSIL